MPVKPDRPELLAPCGSMESLSAALRAGADAVYIGGLGFSARQNAQNFSHEEITGAVSLCHRRGVKIYQALNIAVFDSELESLATEIEFACKAGIDGLIIQDRAAERIIKRCCPDMPIHASTQMTLHFSDGLLLAKEHGYKRVVLARELPEAVISELCKLGIETEIFVHGALCMSVSGQCYLSGIIGSRSANRGLCAGACRLPLSSAGMPNDSDRYALSLKDLSLIDCANNLPKVSSIKIEGRMKRPEYVEAATGELYNALDGLDYDKELLTAVFSRSGFTSGYFSGRRDGDMFGARSREDVFQMTESLSKIRDKYKNERKRFEIDFDFKARAGVPCGLSASDGYRAVHISGTVPQTAINKPLTEEAAAVQISKLGGTFYKAGKIVCEIDDGIMLPLSEINSLRRRAIDALDDLRESVCTVIKTFDFNRLEPVSNNHKSEKRSGLRLWVSVTNLSQLEKIKDCDCEKVIIPLDSAKEYCERGYDPKRAILSPPRFTFDFSEVERKLSDAKNLGFGAAMVTNSGYIRTLRRLGLDAIGGFGLNITNSLSANEYANDGLCALTLSFELKAAQLSKIKPSVPTGAVIYGKLPLMVMANCPIKAETGCKKCSGELTDRTGAKFPVLCHMKKGLDYNELLNSKTLYIPDKLARFDTDFGILMFTSESSSEAARILSDYKSGTSRNGLNDLTNGLYFRGIY